MNLCNKNKLIFRNKLEILSKKYKQIFIINLFIHLKRMARFLEKNDTTTSLTNKLKIFNAFVMTNFKKIHMLLK